MPECVVQAIKTTKQKGQSQYDRFVEESLVKCLKAITDTVYRNKHLTSQEIKFQFSRVTVICLQRSISLAKREKFFKHKNHASPPSLSCAGKMRSRQKSELVKGSI